MFQQYVILLRSDSHQVLKSKQKSIFIIFT